MSAIGGPAETISIAGREFRCTADNTVNMKLGGYENTHEANGDGSTRILKTRTLAKLSGVAVEVDNQNQDFEFLTDVANGAEDVDVVITYTDGTSYAGVLGIDGELANDVSKATATFDMAGGGKLKQL
ncbi:hypothetical protein M0R36_10535 [bacterium]|jgi:hypothetical protein|nr:hypothetical protein [bacterium]